LTFFNFPNLLANILCEQFIYEFNQTHMFDDKLSQNDRLQDDLSLGANGCSLVPARTALWKCNREDSAEIPVSPRACPAI
jgi:hypothetical protein